MDESSGKPYYGMPVAGKPAAPVTPTQSKHPVRAMLRTILAVGVPLVAFLPQIVDAAGLSRYSWVGGVLVVAASITRVLAVPGINSWLAKYLPPLAAAPK